MWKYQGSYLTLCIEKGLNLGQVIGFSTMTNAPAHKTISVKEFLAQKLITEKEYPSYSPDMDPNNFKLFSENKVWLKVMKISRYWRYQKMRREHWKLLHNRRSKNVSNSGSIVGKSIAAQRVYFEGDPSQLAVNI